MGSMVSAGRVGKLFGTSGELSISLYDAFPDTPDLEEPLFVRIDSLTVPLFMEKFERRGQRGAVVRFADIDTPLRASELVGMELLIEAPESDGQSDDEIYFEDLVGYRADLGDGVQGEIVGYVDNDLNPLFEVETAGRIVLIPAAEELIDSFDEQKRIVGFDLPEGLIDLY